MKKREQKADLLKGVAAGLAGGLVASWVMNRFQAAWTQKQEGFDKPHGAQSGQPSEGEDSADSPEKKEQQDDAAVRTAKVISKDVLGHELKPDEERSAGEVVHYVFGVATGGLYGAMAEVAPIVGMGVGIPFGAIFWVLADETIVPFLGLSKGPSGYRLPTHLYALSSHIVYGVTAEVIRRLVRARLLM